VRLVYGRRITNGNVKKRRKGKEDKVAERP
jgi:hypothetical protein